ncbi:SDR family oxidoreductase [Undibacterium sp. JH2W]|uniref:SDR family oxidoreductase n=1 Tax=Undibacterium sp. JH2W TaxID=3413037 RepID=UPI003BF3C342
MQKNSRKKVALITGTSSGIGLASAIAMAQAGYVVVATMRNLAKADALRQAAQLAAVEIDIQHLDVQDQASIEQTVHRIMQSYGRIDVLLNNAGAGYFAALEEVRIEEVQQVMDVNFYGVLRVTQAVLPHMREAHAGRILTVSSVGGLIGQPFNDIYCAAKFAVEGMMESLAPVAQRFGVQVCLIEPGPVNTEFVANVRAHGSRPEQHIDDYAVMRDAYLAGTEQAFASMGQTPQAVGEFIAGLADGAHLPLRAPTSDFVRSIIARKYVDTSGDSVLALNSSRLPALK